jgi:hypothetical protein
VSMAVGASASTCSATITSLGIVSSARCFKVCVATPAPCLILSCRGAHVRCVAAMQTITDAPTGSAEYTVAMQFAARGSQNNLYEFDGNPALAMVRVGVSLCAVS